MQISCAFPSCMPHLAACMLAFHSARSSPHPGISVCISMPVPCVVQQAASQNHLSLHDYLSFMSAPSTPTTTLSVHHNVSVSSDLPALQVTMPAPLSLFLLMPAHSVLASPVLAAASIPVCLPLQVWMTAVELEMRRTLYQITKEGVFYYAKTPRCAMWGCIQ